MNNDLNLRAIRFDARNSRFQFGHLVESLQTIGSRLATALATGKDEILFRGLKRSGDWTENYPIVLTVGYVEQMLRFVATHGWFWDDVDTVPQYVFDGDRAFKSDHVFTGGQITPGLYWSEVQALHKTATELEERAVAHETNHGRSVAEELRSSARRLKATADRLLVKDLPKYRRSR